MGRHSKWVVSTARILLVVIGFQHGAVLADAVANGKALGTDMSSILGKNALFGNAPGDTASTMSLQVTDKDGNSTSLSLELDASLAGTDAPEDTDDVEAAYGSDSNTIAIGAAKSQALRSLDSPEGDAYRLLVNSANRSHPDLTNDPIWNETDEVLSNEDVLKNFADCDSDVTFDKKSNRSVHLPQIKTCERYTDAAFGCDALHEMDVGVFAPDGGADYSVGYTSNDSQSGQAYFTISYNNTSLYQDPDLVCQDRDVAISIDILAPESIYLAELSSVEFGGPAGSALRVLIGGEEVFASEAYSNALEYRPTTYTGGAFGVTGVAPAEYKKFNDWNSYCENPYYIGTVTPASGFVFDAHIPCECQGGSGSYSCTYFPVPTYNFFNPDQYQYYGDVDEPYSLSFANDPRRYSQRVCEVTPSSNIYQPCACNYQLNDPENLFSGLKASCVFLGGALNGVTTSDNPSTGLQMLPYNRVVNGTGNRNQVTTLFSEGKSSNIQLQLRGGACSAYIRFRVLYDPKRAAKQDNWYPQDCIDEMNEVQAYLADGRCTGTLQCSDMPAVDVINGERAILINGVHLYDSQVQASPIPGIDKLCRRATYQATCKTTGGEGECFIDIFGDEQCHGGGDGGGSGEPFNDCETLEQDPTCAFKDSQCVDQGEDGKCYAWSDTYDCGEDVDIDEYSSEETVVCAGSLSCLGGECTEETGTKSDSFTKVASTLQAVDFMKREGQCTAASCVIFKGQRLECKFPTGEAKKLQDCCFEPSGPTLSEYLAALLTVGKVDDIIMSLDDTSMVQGAWSTVRDPIVDSWSAVKDYWTSAVENITGKTATDVAVEETASTFSQGIMESAKKFVSETFGEDVAASLFAEEGGATVFNEYLSGIAGGLMTAYATYKAIELALALLYKCGEEEYQLAARLATESCHYVDRYCKKRVKVLKASVCTERRKVYCCYDSPLGRIISQQLRLQDIGTPWKTGESSKYETCPGFTIQEFAQADWDRVDLGEWVAMLQNTGNFPTPENLSIETVTGEGGVFDLIDEAERKNAFEKERDRTEGMDMHGIHKEAENQLWGAVIPSPVQ